MPADRLTRSGGRRQRLVRAAANQVAPSGPYRSSFSGQPGRQPSGQLCHLGRVPTPAPGPTQPRTPATTQGDLVHGYSRVKNYSATH